MNNNTQTVYQITLSINGQDQGPIELTNPEECRSTMAAFATIPGAEFSADEITRRVTRDSHLCDLYEMLSESLADREPAPGELEELTRLEASMCVKTEIAKPFAVETHEPPKTSANAWA